VADRADEGGEVVDAADEDRAEDDPEEGGDPAEEEAGEDGPDDRTGARDRGEVVPEEDRRAGRDEVDAVVLELGGTARRSSRPSLREIQPP